LKNRDINNLLDLQLEGNIEKEADWRFCFLFFSICRAPQKDIGTPNSGYIKTKK
jgi:hypothetical protein